MRPEARVGRSAHVAGICLLALAGCAHPESPEGGDLADQAVRDEASLLATTPVIHAYISDSLQIDQLGTGLTPQDANLFVGADPADGTASVDKPAGGPGDYLDWDDLGPEVLDHRLLDLNLPGGKDPSAFPRSNECVGTAQVLSKMDLTYIASANNTSYAYFGVQRSNNNGDAGYYWLFTRKAPQLIANDPRCRPGELRLVYDISGPGAGGTGDVLLAGHFKPNGTPLLTVYTANADANGVGAVAAVDFTAPIWTIDPSGTAAVAVNTSPTRAGSFGSQGVIATNGTDLEVEIFAEAAVPMRVFTGEDVCGATFHGSVVTRSSGSGGTNPDLKDLAGPAVFNFENVTAYANIDTECGTSVAYSAGALAEDITVTCHWEFDDGQTAEGCSGTVDLAPGVHTAAVTVTDTLTGCDDVVVTEEFVVGGALDVTVDVSDTCAQDFDYLATVEGSSGTIAYEWTFYGPQGEVIGASDAAGGNLDVSAAGAYSASVVVSDTRSNGAVCHATGGDSVDVYAPLGVALALDERCDQAFDYTASVTGGSPATALSWTFDGPNGESGTSSAASGIHAGSQGAWSASVTAYDVRASGLECDATATGAVGVHGDLAITATLDPTCGPSFTYDATTSGGSGGAVTWAFSGPGAVTASNGTATVSDAGTYTGTATVSETRGDQTCTAHDSDSADAFPALTASITLTESCEQGFGYQAAVAGGSGASTIAWTFSGPGTATDDGAGTVTTSSPGAYLATALVQDARLDATCAVAPSATTTVYAPLDVWAFVTGGCEEDVGYAAFSSGGSGSTAFAWTFSDGSKSSTASGTLAVGPQATGGASYGGDVTATDARSSGLACSDTASGSALVYSPIQVSLTAAAGGGTCPDLASDAITFAADISGGTGAFDLFWTDAACDGADACTVDPNDAQFCEGGSMALTVADAGVCPDATSETETWAKVTTVTVSDN